MKIDLKDILSDLKILFADSGDLELVHSLESQIQRLQTEMQTYKHAFETTAADRDRIRGELDAVDKAGRDSTGRSLQVLSEIALGLMAHVLMNEVKIPVAQLDKRLAHFVDQHEDWVKLLREMPPERKSLASDGLLKIAGFIMREAVVSELALEFVDSALVLDDRFRGANHALWTYHWRRNTARLGSYFANGVNAGVWPDQGTRAIQKRALDKGFPSMLLVTLPKSGSIFIWSTILKSLEMPNFSIAVPGRTAAGAKADEVIVPELAGVFSQGGFLTAHHFAPNEANLRQLKANGITKFVFHIRDPRQAATSWWHYQIKIGSIPHQDRSRGQIEDVIWEHYFSRRARWMLDWLHVIETDPDFDIMISTLEGMVGREQDHISDILDFMGFPRAAYTLRVPPKTDAVHFRKGAKTEWLEFFSEDFKRRSLEFVPNEMARRFGWCEVK